MNAPGDLVGGAGAENRRDLFPGLIGRQRPEGDRTDECGAAQVREPGDERVAAGQVLAAEREDTYESLGPQVVRQERHHVACRRIDPLHVFEHQDGRRIGRKAPEHAEEVLEETGGRARGVGRCDVDRGPVGRRPVGPSVGHPSVGRGAVSRR